MNVLRTLSDMKHVGLTASSCALGMFDGIHVGHHAVLGSALHHAQQLNIPSTVFSFAQHPQFLLSSTPPEILSSLDERLAIFESLGFDYALILDFDDSLKSRSAIDFVQTLLLDHLGVKNISVGYDHCFGAGRQGDGAFLKQCGKEYGFNVEIIDPVRASFDGTQQIVSSTLIRKLLRFGKILHANALLGYEYRLTGSVKPGEQRGRKLGFPTANIQPPEFQLVPAVGIYSGIAILKNHAYKAVCNIGHCPTFGTQMPKRIEVHLLNYTGPEFYNESLTFQFHQKIRDEETFESIDALTAQIQADCDYARNSLHLNDIHDTPTL